MLIEDLTGRDEDVTQVNIDGYLHYFRRQADGRKVAEVNSQSHINFLLSSGNFAKYEPDKASESTDELEEWNKWKNSWLRMTPKEFIGYQEDRGNGGVKFHAGFVHENVDMFNQAPKAIYDDAIKKWNRQMPILVDSGEIRSSLIWPGIAR
jgi:hypothetical protein